MGPFSLHSPTAVTHLPSSPMRKAAMERCTPFAARSLPFRSSKSSFSDHRDITSRPLSSGTFKVATGSNAKTVEATETETVSKDNDLVFVAGATGRVGSRTVRELLKLGFRVRAGVRSTQRAETLVQSVQQMKLDGDRDKPVERLEIVECDLENPSVIGPAIGSASTVICCIGASEKEVFDITGPYRIDFQATKNLIEAGPLQKAMPRQLGIIHWERRTSLYSFHPNSSMANPSFATLQCRPSPSAPLRVRLPPWLQGSTHTLSPPSVSRKVISTTQSRPLLIVDSTYLTFTMGWERSR